MVREAMKKPSILVRVVRVLHATPESHRKVCYLPRKDYEELCSALEDHASERRQPVFVDDKMRPLVRMTPCEPKKGLRRIVVA